MVGEFSLWGIPRPAPGCVVVSPRDTRRRRGLDAMAAWVRTVLRYRGEVALRGASDGGAGVGRTPPPGRAGGRLTTGAMIFHQTAG